MSQVNDDPVWVEQQAVFARRLLKSLPATTQAKYRNWYTTAELPKLIEDLKAEVVFYADVLIAGAKFSGVNVPQLSTTIH